MYEIVLNHQISLGMNGFVNWAIYTEQEVDLSNLFVVVEGFAGNPDYISNLFSGRIGTGAKWLDNPLAAQRELEELKRSKYAIPTSSIVYIREIETTYRKH